MGGWDDERESTAVSASEKRFATAIKCEHCNNTAPMEIVAQYSQMASIEEVPGYLFDQGNVYGLLVCPACNEITLRSYFWHEVMDDDDVKLKTLYPSGSRMPQGLPDKIMRAYEAALRVRSVDPNAYAVLARRLLEMLCEDRCAQGRDLFQKLSDLASKGEIPNKLVGVANGLRSMGNIGAHATLGELTPAEIPILDDLTRAILEYVYSAPALAQQAEDRLNQLKQSQQRQQGGTAAPNSN